MSFARPRLPFTMRWFKHLRMIDGRIQMELLSEIAKGVSADQSAIPPSVEVDELRVALTREVAELRARQSEIAASWKAIDALLGPSRARLRRTACRPSSR